MEMFAYSRLLTIRKDEWVLKYLEKAGVTPPELIDMEIRVYFTGYGDYFDQIEIEEKTVWTGHLSTP